MVEKELVGWGMEVPGPTFCGQWTMLYIGAAEMAQGRGRWRKWRGAVVGDGSGARPSLFSFLLRRTWAASCFITFIPREAFILAKRHLPREAFLFSAKLEVSAPLK